MTVPKYDCVCDTNIWVNVCLGNVQEVYLEKFKKIGIAEVVKNEIIKWDRNEDEFKKICSLFYEYENRNLFIISLVDLDPITRKLIEDDLKEEGYIDLDNSDKKLDDLGEFVSFLIAYHLEIPFIHTSDTEFSDSTKSNRMLSKYEGIEIVSWYEISRVVTDNDDERIKLNTMVEDKRKIMRIRHEKRSEKINMERKMEQLKNKFSKRH